MRARGLRWNWAASVIVYGFAALSTTGLCPGAQAQSLLDNLFGNRQTVPVQSNGLAGGVRLNVRPLPPPAADMPRRREARDEHVSQMDAGNSEAQAAEAWSGLSSHDRGGYQTMCVRTCDGYYWPVSFPAKRSDFERDAKVCQSTCGAEAKLYVRSGPGAGPEEMRDQQGRSYGATPTAFAYRKGLVNGCSCRGMPWSTGERSRHEGYALIEQEKAIRIAETEAGRASEVAQAKEAAETEAKHQALLKQVAEADARQVARIAQAAGVPPPGPKEAAAIAAFSAGTARPAAAGQPVVEGEPVTSDATEADNEVQAAARLVRDGKERGKVQAGSRQRVARRVMGGRPAIRVPPQYAAAPPPSKFWLFQ